MNPIARSWGTFVVQTLESCGNSSKFHLVRAVAIQAIMNADEINVGRIIAKDLRRRIANESKKSFTYRHCSLINTICIYAGVSRVGNDLMLKKAGEMEFKWLEKVTDATPNAPRRQHVKKAREVDEEP